MCLRQTKTAAHLIAHPCNPAPRLLVPASKHRPSGEEFLFGPCGRRASARLASSHKLGRPVGLAVGWAPTGLELNRIGLVLEAWRTLAGLVQEPWRYLTTVWRSTARSAARATARPQRRRREDFAPRMGCGQQETPARLMVRPRYRGPRPLVPASKHSPNGEEFLFGPCGRRGCPRSARSASLPARLARRRGGGARSRAGSPSARAIPGHWRCAKTQQQTIFLLGGNVHFTRDVRSSPRPPSP